MQRKPPRLSQSTTLSAQAVGQNPPTLPSHNHQATLDMAGLVYHIRDIQRRYHRLGEAWDATKTEHGKAVERALGALKDAIVAAYTEAKTRAEEGT